MGRKKNVFKSVRKLSCKGEDIFAKNLKVNPQLGIRLTRLNIPKHLDDEKTNNFTRNANCKNIKKTLNTHQSPGSHNGRTSRTVKSMKNVVKNRSQSCIKSTSDSFTTYEKKKKKLFVSGPANDSRLFMNEAITESLILNNESDSTKQYLNKENECSDTTSLDSQELGLEDKDEAVLTDGNPADSITRTDKVIDTFLHALRKTTDDNSILSALQRDYICNHCEQGFLKKGTLRKHMLTCSLGNGEKKYKKRTKHGNHSCPMCGIKYVNKYSLDKHNANIHNLKKTYKCLVCSQYFYNEYALTLHCRSRHGLGGSDIYKCPYCDATFNLRGDLNYHCRKIHHTTKYYVCEMCLECFKNEDTCKLHEKSHGFCCDICMYKTKSECEMDAHRLTHLYVVVYKCHKCSRTFKAKQYFTRHIKVHEKERKL